MCKKMAASFGIFFMFSHFSEAAARIILKVAPEKTAIREEQQDITGLSSPLEKSLK